MNIKTQQSTAKYIYSIMEEVSSHCILVGGAPRDWYFGREASDLDFFFVKKEDSEVAMQGAISSLDLVRKEGTVEHHLKGYQAGPLIIWEGCKGGLKVQLVEIESEGVFKLAVDQLHLSISKIVWTPCGTFVLYPEFEKTVKDKIIYCKKGYDPQSKYAQKIAEKFKDMRFRLDGDASNEAPVNKLEVQW